MALTNIITYHPFKFLYALSAILLNLLKSPLTILYYSIPQLRQHPAYTFRQALRTHIVKTVLYHNSLIRIHTPLITTPTRAEHSHLIPIPPAPAPFYTGPCADRTIRPQTVCGYWYPAAYDPQTDAGKKLVLHFHGGGYVIGDCRPKESGFAGATLAGHVAKNLQVSYRLASNPGGRFPAALQDAVSAYKYVLDLGVPPGDVVLGGDSAGGNLVVALLRYISTGGGDGGLPSPGAALLWSPWLDLESSLDARKIWDSPNEEFDYIVSGFGAWGARLYAPVGEGVGVGSEWVSPKKFPFKTETAVWVQMCGTEVLYHDGREFFEGMRGVEGNRVEWYVVPVAPHDVILTGKLTGFEKEAVRAAKAAREWLDGL